MTRDAMQVSEGSGRSTAPVFVLGCPRSGTTLLYHMILSAGGFAVYRAESCVFSLLNPRYGPLDTAAAKESLLEEWLDSVLFQRSGLDAAEIRARVLGDCANAGDFLRVVMSSIAEQQQVTRWAECTPTHILYLSEIKRTIPDAKIIHIIRDGRDAALSMEKLGWIRPMPWDKGGELLAAGLFWAWIVETGQREGAKWPLDYSEIRFEDLVTHPRETLSRVGRFIDHDLNYDRIIEAGIGSVSEPNTSFQRGEGPFNPVARWRTAMTPSQLNEFESILGSSLSQLGYEVLTPLEHRQPTLHKRMMKQFYPSYFDVKHWIKSNTPFSRRFVDTSIIHPCESRCSDEAPSPSQPIDNG